jgi:hypothetical protein
MKKLRIAIDHLSQLFLAFFIIYVTASCVFDTSGLPPSNAGFTRCTTEISNCVKTPDDLDVDITGNPLFLQITQYKKVSNLWGDKLYSYQLYYDSYLSILNIELSALKGALLIKTGYYDWNKDTEDFLTITLKNNIENFYIAYDSSVKDADKPKWLTAEYQPVLHPHSNYPYHIVTPYSDHKLEIWKRNIVPVQGDIVRIPGNIYDCSGCYGKNLLMYVVIIEPKVKIDCNTGYYNFGRRGFQGCFDSLAEAGKAAEESCNSISPLKTSIQLVCRDTFCDSIQSCPDTLIGGALTIEPSSFPYNSEIEFNPSKHKSMANIMIKNKQFNNQAVKGNLHFEYQYETHNMKLDSMTLRINPLDTDVGKFQDITITLWKFSNATCKDTMPIYHQPCTHYEIAQGDFVVGLSAKLKGNNLLFAGTNQNVIYLTIDHKKRTFNFQGPLHTAVQVDGKDTPLDISIDLTGHFVNFAPKAFGRESTKSVECGLSRTNNKLISGNKYPVKLDSAGSFEIYDALPSNPANYEWYEDFGLVTEKLWGNGTKHTIAPFNLGYGVHNFTLLLKDKNGLVDTDTFDIEVRDTTAPAFAMEPNDIIVFQSPDKKGPVKIDMGQPTAYDTCSEKVMISNDAPKDLLFSPGDTLVTWTADDGKGNITTKVQKVSVIPIEGSAGDFIRNGSLRLMEITNKSMNSIEACKAKSKCKINFEPLINTFEVFISHVKKASIAENKRILQRQIVNKLEPALAALKIADSFSRRSNESGKIGRMNLRNTALNKLEDARNLIGEATDISHDMK